MALELLAITPLVIVLLLLVVGLGRFTHGRQLVDDASAAASRAASLAATPAQASADARQIAADTVGQGGVSCRQLSIDVNVSTFGPGGQVTVTVHCTASLSRLAMTGLPATVRLSATSTSPLETYRYFAGTNP